MWFILQAVNDDASECERTASAYQNHFQQMINASETQTSEMDGFVVPDQDERRKKKKKKKNSSEMINASGTQTSEMVFDEFVVPDNDPIVYDSERSSGEEQEGKKRRKKNTNKIIADTDSDAEEEATFDDTEHINDDDAEDINDDNAEDMADNRKRKGRGEGNAKPNAKPSSLKKKRVVSKVSK